MTLDISTVVDARDGLQAQLDRLNADLEPLRRAMPFKGDAGYTPTKYLVWAEKVRRLEKRRLKLERGIDRLTDIACGVAEAR